MKINPQLSPPLRGILPYLTLLCWSIPLLIASNGEQSLLAHDEGLYATRARFMLDSGDWINPWTTPHHKTPGTYWLIAICYYFWGMSETTVRLPSLIFSILTGLIVYQIGSLLVNKRVGWLAAAILPLQYLWYQYSRLANPDLPMIFVVMLGILLLLKAELRAKNRDRLTLVAGICLGLGFLIRGFMIGVPLIGILPYLIGENRRHKHLYNPTLYLGIALGLMPTILWFVACWFRYGSDTWHALFNFFVGIGLNEQRNGIIYYFWHIPALSFPWAFFSLLGLGICWRCSFPRSKWLLVGYPLIVFVQITIFATRIPHYSLSLYPFLALLAAIALDWIISREEQQGQPKLILLLINSFLGLLGGLLLICVLGINLAVVMDKVSIAHQIMDYVPMAICLAIPWLSLPLIWRYRAMLAQYLPGIYCWVASLLIANWLGLLVVGHLGLVGNYNPDIKKFIAKPAINLVLENNPVYLTSGGGKTKVLLKFYTPNINQDIANISDLPSNSYAWVKSEQLMDLSKPYLALGIIRDWELIQVLEP